MSSMHPQPILDRREAIVEVVDSFAKSRDYADLPVLEPLIEYILDELVVSNSKWTSAQRAKKKPFDPAYIRDVLVTYLSVLDQNTPLANLNIEDLRNNGAPEAEEAVLKGFECHFHIFKKWC